MIRRLAMLLIILATPAALAADSVYTTGIVSTETAMVFFAIAAVLIAGLLLRRAAGRFAQVIVSYIGELRVRRALGQHGTEQLHDIIVPGAYGGLARIDHAILTSGGILCIRTVHCHGIVFGGQDDAQWTHVDGISRRRFLNPLIQNEGRSRALRNVVPDVPVANLVVFTGNVEFPNPLPTNVIRVDQIDDFLAGKPFGSNKVRDWDAAWMSVQAAVLGDEASRRDFNAQLSFS